MPSSIPQITVIIPAYNHEAYVAEAIESVLSQTHQDLELLVVDDGSTDSTAAVIEDLTRQYLNWKGRLSFLKQANQGICKTLNAALGRARGEFVALLGSDDFYLPEFLEKTLAALTEAPASVAAVYTEGYVIRENGRILSKFSDWLPVPIGKNIHRELLVGNWFPPMGILYRKKALFDVGLFDEQLPFEDYDLLLRLSRIYRIRRLQEPLFAYRRHGSNFTNDAARMSQGIAMIAEKHSDLQNYLKLKEDLKSQKFPSNLKSLNWKNWGLLGRGLLRRWQNRRAERSNIYTQKELYLRGKKA